jgi:VanZ family protein
MSLRARLTWLALLCVACAAYGSFVPLRWRSVGWVEGLRRAAAMPLEPVWHLFNGDFFTNVLVFLPIGFFAAGALFERESRRHHERGQGFVHPPLLAATVLIGSLLLSALLELGQVYIRDRTPSWSDVYAQTLGGTTGAILWKLAGGATVQWVTGAFGASTRRERFFRLVGIYTAGWASYVMLPTVFPHLAHPQLHLWISPNDLSRLVLAGPLSVAALSALPVGAYLALLSARPVRWWAAASMAGAGLGLLAVADRVQQVGAIPADGQFAAGVLGFSSGWLAVGFGWPRTSRCPPRAAFLLLLACLAGLLAVVALCYWAPFDFGVSRQALERRVTVLYTRAPFHRYYWLPPLVALGEIVTLTLLSMTGSLLMFLASSARGRAPAPRTTVLVTAAVFAIVEWGQLYLPGRRADPTDVLIAGLGALLGAAVGRALASPSPPQGAIT